MSIMVDCDSGTRAAPQTPCMRRKATICSSDWAAPHIIEVTVKPTRQAAKKFLRPKREASQPTGAVMMAAATT